MDKDRLIPVTNRHNSLVGYPVPDNTNGLERDFAPGETKQISFEELQKLSWMPGGMYLLQNYFVIKDEEAIKEILGDVEPEYYYSEEDVKNLLENGTLDQLMDCLDFGTDGVIELLKSMAVELEIADMRKRNTITKKTGFDINKAIEIKHLEAEDEVEETPVETKARRSAPVTKEATSGRRTAAPAPEGKYKVVSK